MLGRVHIVDDDEFFRKAIERHLRYAGYEVETYASAQHLLDRLPSESEPGCILLDVRLPGLTGPELQERLRELGSTMPIIFITGYPDIRTTVKTIKAGAEDFLTKPISSDQLLQAVERAVAHHNATHRQKTKWTCSRSYRGVDAARAGSLLACHSRQPQQAGRSSVRLYRAYHQGPSPQSDGENAGSVLTRTCLACRADRVCIG